MRRFVLLPLALALMVSVEAGAKGPIDVKVCGVNGCQEIESLQASRELTTPVFRAQGRPDPPPSASSGWFEVTMRFGDFPERFALLQDPDYIRAVGKREGIVAPGEKDGVYGWLRLTPAEARAHRSLTEGLEPLPISELPHLGATAPDLAVTARAAETSEGGKAPTTLWLALGAAVASLVAVGFVLSRRRRRPGPQPAL